MGRICSMPLPRARSGGAFLELLILTVLAAAFTCGDGTGEADYGGGLVCGYHGCLSLTASGGVFQWYTSGTLGTAPSNLPKLVAVSHTSNVACGITAADGRPYCWGNQWVPEIGNYPTAAVGLTKIGTGMFSVCGLRGSDLSLFCWGSPDARLFQNGYPLGTITQGYTDFCMGLYMLCVWNASTVPLQITCWGESDGNTMPLPGYQFKIFKCRSNSFCGIAMDGSAVCWGMASRGLTPQPVVLAGDFVDVAGEADGPPYCAIRRADGNITCFTTTDSWGSVLMQRWTLQPPPGPYAAITSWDCARRVDGGISCWGNYHRDPPYFQDDGSSFTTITTSTITTSTATSSTATTSTATSSTTTLTSTTTSSSTVSTTSSSTSTATTSTSSTSSSSSTTTETSSTTTSSTSTTTESSTSTSSSTSSSSSTTTETSSTTTSSTSTTTESSTSTSSSTTSSSSTSTDTSTTSSSSTTTRTTSTSSTTTTITNTSTSTTATVTSTTSTTSTTTTSTTTQSSSTVSSSSRTSTTVTVSATPSGLLLPLPPVAEAEFPDLPQPPPAAHAQEEMPSLAAAEVAGGAVSGVALIMIFVGGFLYVRYRYLLHDPTHGSAMIAMQEGAEPLEVGWSRTVHSGSDTHKHATLSEGGALSVRSNALAKKDDVLLDPNTVHIVWNLDLENLGQYGIGLEGSDSDPCSRRMFARASSSPGPVSSPRSPRSWAPTDNLHARRRRRVDAYARGQWLELYRNHQEGWTHARIQGPAESFSELACYQVIFGQEMQSDDLVFMDELRPPLEKGELVTCKTGRGTWAAHGIIRDEMPITNPTRRYLVEIEGNKGAKMMSAARLRRRFPPCMKVLAYMGHFQGWHHGAVIGEIEGPPSLLNIDGRGPRDQLPDWSLVEVQLETKEDAEMETVQVLSCLLCPKGTRAAASIQEAASPRTGFESGSQHAAGARGPSRTSTPRSPMSAVAAERTASPRSLILGAAGFRGQRGPRTPTSLMPTFVPVVPSVTVEDPLTL